MLGLAVAVFARSHRLAIEGDVACVVAVGEVQRAENIGQGSGIDGPHGLGQRRMTRRFSADKAQRSLLRRLRLRPRTNAAIIPRRPHNSDRMIRLRIDHSL